MPTSALQAPSPSGLYILSAVAWGCTKPRGSITLADGGTSERRGAGGRGGGGSLGSSVGYGFLPISPRSLFSSSDGQPRRLIHSTSLLSAALCHITQRIPGIVLRRAQALYPYAL